MVRTPPGWTIMYTPFHHEPRTLVHRIDLPCKQAGFSTPPFDIHMKLLSNADSTWTLLAHAQAGTADLLTHWLRQHPGMDLAQAAPGIAPKLIRVETASIPAPWSTMIRILQVHHLTLTASGTASWFVEGTPDELEALVAHFEAQAPTPDEGPSMPLVHERVVNQSGAPLSHRQFEALASAVAHGYYEIPHRLDLRTLAQMNNVSLGSVSELLRRAEGAILTQYVDARLMAWPDTPRRIEPLVRS